jgi:hypothetical protein
MTAVIKNGTIVTADPVSKSDVPIFEVAGFVTVTEEKEHRAVRLRYAMLNDPTGRNIPAAVRAAAAHAKKRGLKNWIAETAAVRDDPSEKDAAWVGSQDFRDILLGTSVDTFVLIPAPDDAPGVDNSWIPEWRVATETGFGGKIAVHILKEEAARGRPGSATTMRTS